MNARSRATAALAAAYAAVLALVGSQLGTWTDEEYTLATTAHGVAYATLRAIRYELQAPLYFAALALWRTLDDDVWFARLFSIACATGLFVVLTRIGRRIDASANPLPFALLAACNPFAIRAAFDIRVYALALVLSGALWLAFDEGFVRGRPRGRIAFVVLALAATYTQYFTAFALVGYGAAVLVRRSRRDLVAYAICCAAIGVGLVPLAIVVPSQLGTLPTGHPSLASVVPHTLLHPALDLLFPYPDGVFGATVHHAYLVLALLGAAALLACALVARGSLAPALAPVAGVLATYVAASAYLRVTFAEHYFVALYVPFAAAAYAVARTLARGRYRAANAIFAVTAALAAVVLVRDYRALAQPGDWNRVARYLDSHARAGDAIAIFEPDARPALLRRYRGPVVVFAYPRVPNARHYSVADVSVASASVASAAFAKLAAYPRVWFVESGDCDRHDPQYGCDYVEIERERLFRAFAHATFYGSVVDGLVPRANVRKSVARGSSTSRSGVPESRRKTAVFKT